VQEQANRIYARIERYDWRPRSSGGRVDMARRWLEDGRHESDDRPAPQHICASCVRPWSTQEVC